MKIFNLAPLSVTLGIVCVPPLGYLMGSLLAGCLLKR